MEISTTTHTPETGFSMQFIPKTGTDTIIIFVTYLPSVDRKVMNIYIETAKKVISINSKSRGWNSWLKVKEQIELGSTAAR
jgi:hypothetical protein